MLDYLNFDTPSKIGASRHDEDGQVCPKDQSSPAALSQSQPQPQPFKPCSASDMVLDDTISSNPEPRSDRETNPSIDNITHRLSSSHLRVEGCYHPSPLSRESTSTCSSASSYFPPKLLDLEVDDPYQRSLLSTKSPRGTVSTMPSVVAPPFASPWEEDPVKDPPHHRQDLKRLWRNMSNNDLQNSRTIQTLVEGMVSTGTQCNVYTPPQAPDTPNHVGNANGMDYELEIASFEVDENPGDDADYQSPFIEKFLSLRRASGTTGVRKSGFPLHPSSTDTALRCQHLVRNRPRMRKRSKISRQPSLAKLSAGEAPSVGPYSAAS